MGYHFLWPVPSSQRITSKYGWRICPYHGKELHSGIDIGAAHGAPIQAAAAGTARTAKGSSYGNYVTITHSNGTVSYYCHMSKTANVNGKRVMAGECIGYVGSTGQSTGNHCHFEVRAGGSSINTNPGGGTVSYSYGNGQSSPAAQNVQKDSGRGGNGAAGGFGGSSSGGSGSAAAKSTGARSTAEALRTLTGATTTAGGTVVQADTPKKQEITTVALKASQGAAGTRNDSLRGVNTNSVGLEILLENDRIYRPVLTGRVTLERHRSGAPSMLRFTVLKDGVLNFREGNPVCLRYEGTRVFYGYVFTKSRKDLHEIEVTAYDQIRYLKNSDSLRYGGITYGALVKRICGEYGLTAGEIADTGYAIPDRLEEGTLLDILGRASDETLVNKGTLYVLYDEYGAITLKPMAGMQVPLYLDESTCGGLDYRTGIDDGVYNRIRLAADNSTTGQRELYDTNGDTQSRWGLLQY